MACVSSNAGIEGPEEGGRGGRGIEKVGGFLFQAALCMPPGKRMCEVVNMAAAVESVWTASWCRESQGEHLVSGQRRAGELLAAGAGWLAAVEG